MPVIIVYFSVLQCPPFNQLAIKQQFYVLYRYVKERSFVANLNNEKKKIFNIPLENDFGVSGVNGIDSKDRPPRRGCILT